MTEIAKKLEMEDSVIINEGRAKLFSPLNLLKKLLIQSPKKRHLYVLKLWLYLSRILRMMLPILNQISHTGEKDIFPHKGEFTASYVAIKISKHPIQ